MKKEKFYRIMGSGINGRTNCYVKEDQGIKHAFFVDMAKVSCGARKGLFANGFIVYFVRYSNNTWDAIEERTGLSCRPPQVDVRICKYDEIHDAVAQFKEYIFTHLVYGEEHNEFIQNCISMIKEANENK